MSDAPTGTATDDHGGGGDLDLTPRDTSPRPLRRRRRWPALAAGAVVLVAIGLVLFNGLENATTYFYNVDQAVSQRKELGDRRFRMQGNVLDGSIARQGESVTFVLAFNRQQVCVTHTGDVPDLFQPAIPVVIEGSFDGSRGGLAEFRSDRILVRHDETYSETNAKRLSTAQADVAVERGAVAACAAGATGTP